MQEKIQELQTQFKSALEDIKCSRQTPQQTGIGKIIKEVGDYDENLKKNFVDEYKPVFEEWRKNHPEFIKKKREIVILEDGGKDGIANRIRISGIQEKPRIKRPASQPRIREVKKENADFKLNLNGKISYLSKGRAVHACIKYYINTMKPGITLQEIHKDFDGVAKNKYHVCNELALAKEHSVKYKRYFLREDDIIKLQDGTKIAISKEWGATNMPIFAERAISLGIPLEHNK